MTKGFRREKLAPEPTKTRGWRTIRQGAHRVRVALLPGGGSVAVALLHPKGEDKRNPHCLVGYQVKEL